MAKIKVKVTVTKQVTEETTISVEAGDMNSKDIYSEDFCVGASFKKVGEDLILSRQSEVLNDVKPQNTSKLVGAPKDDS